MVANYTDNLRLTQQGDNDNPNTWGDIVNAQVIQLIEDAVAGVAVINCTGAVDVHLDTSTVNGGTDDARHMILELTGILGANINLVVPAVEKLYMIRSDFTGAFTINVKPNGGAGGVTFINQQSTILYTSGTNIYSLGAGSAALLAANNLSDLTDVAAARANLGLGTAAVLDVGTGPNDIIQLDGTSKLPAVDGSNLFNVTTAPLGLGTAAFLDVGTAPGNVVQLNGSGQLPAVSGALLTNLTAANLIGALPAISGALLTGLTASQVPGVPIVSTDKVIMGALTVQWGTGIGSLGGANIFFGTPFSAVPYAMVMGVKSPFGGTPRISSLLANKAVVDSSAPQGAHFYYIVVGPT
jgi:hypothetical protein